MATIKKVERVYAGQIEYPTAEFFASLGPCRARQIKDDHDPEIVERPVDIKQADAFGKLLWENS